jgi:hypothetical protein
VWRSHRTTAAGSIPMLFGSNVATAVSADLSSADHDRCAVSGRKAGQLLTFGLLCMRSSCRFGEHGVHRVIDELVRFFPIRRSAQTNWAGRRSEVSEIGIRGSDR